jgi:membrane-bound lytic murein transglycosylase D
VQKVCLLALLLFAALLAHAQEEIPLDSLMQSAEQWAKDNLDDDALAALQNVDQEKVKEFLKDFQKRSQGEYVVDMAQLKDAAHALLPLLESYEETTPYAVWLRAQLDYLDVAEEFRTNLPPVTVQPGEAPKLPPNPAPEKQREVWKAKLADRPWPKQAKPYIPRLKPIFVAERVPAELVWIAEVESSFDRRARSPEDAAGLFQLRPATARHYGLRVGLFDQRYNPEESARAAAKYLRYLHGKFPDWRLALAAYNAGEGTVSKVLKQRKAKTFDAIAAYLPAETQMYVPRIEAVLLRREGVKLSEL